MKWHSFWTLNGSFTEIYMVFADNKVYFRKLDSLGYIFVGSIFIRLAVVASQSANFRQIPWQFAFIAVQGHPRSSILVLMESAHMSSY